jgi:hypothetical protein
MRTFHGVDMIKSCAQSFLDERGIVQYEFSGEHDYYNDVLERIYRPLAESGLIQEYENNNFVIPADSRLHLIHETGVQPSLQYFGLITLLSNDKMILLFELLLK